jgi:hypothetical protein
MPGDLFGTLVQPLFEEHRADFLAQARAIALELGRRGKPVTINDVPERITVPPDLDPRVMGAVFRTGDWVNLGYTSSRRRVCPGRPVAQFLRRDTMARDAA